VRIVAVGIANSGKSLCLSALSDTPDLFESGDVPGLTVEPAIARFGMLQLVDSPGYDAREDEARRADEVISRDSLLLWCHSLRYGELLRSELDLLQRFKSRKRLIFVLTHIDALADVEMGAVVAAKIGQQIAGELDWQLAPFSIRNPLSRRDFSSVPWALVGSELYMQFRGHPKGSKAREKSGIPQLRDYLLWRAAMERQQ
jgi:hypothetical protein